MAALSPLRYCGFDIVAGGKGRRMRKTTCAVRGVKKSGSWQREKYGEESSLILQRLGSRVGSVIGEKAGAPMGVPGLRRQGQGRADPVHASTEGFRNAFLQPANWNFYTC